MSLPLIILEGADCSGKTTLANKLMGAVGESGNADYVHFCNEPHSRFSIARFYAEGMIPAVRGQNTVIMDRCWLSEEPYCKVYRPKEHPRTGDAHHRILERLALRCNPLVVYCKPPWEEVRRHFMDRTAEEYLDNLGQLEQVREGYNKVLHRSHLQTVVYDWTNLDHDSMLDMLIERVTSVSNDLEPYADSPGAGNPLAANLVVGNGWKFTGEYDTHFHWPYGSFTSGSLSRWFAAQLDRLKVPERDFYWVNHDDLTEKTFNDMCNIHTFIHVIALTDEAFEQLVQWGIPEGDIYQAPDLNNWNRNKPYPGAQIMKDLTNG